MKSVAFYTLGCKVNQQETESMRLLFEEAGYTSVPFEDTADVYIINTCTVTQVSDKKSRQQISRAHHRNPQAAIAVVGCYAQQAPEEISKLPGVQLVIGTQFKNRIVELVEECRGEALQCVEDIHKARSFEVLPTSVGGARTRVQLKIQDGCDRYCSYCAIPYARGPVRSMQEEEAKRSLKYLSDRKIGEVVLTGIHLMSYGKDLREAASLADLAAYAATLPGIGRVRLGSLDPTLVNEAFIAPLLNIAPDKFCRQFHLSMQSGSEAVLKRMGRRYTPGQYLYAANMLREAFPGCAITTDVIAGFPGETEQEHMETLAFIRCAQLSRIHVFPYSRREGTAAATMANQVPKSIKEVRAHALIAIGKELEQVFLSSLVGSEQTVLLEERKGECMEGYTGNYARVQIADGEEGALVRVRITGVKNGLLIGERVASPS